MVRVIHVMCYKEMMKIDKWLSLWSIGEDHSLSDLKLIKQAGFKGVEIWGEHAGAEESLEYARECNFEIGMHLPFKNLNLSTVNKNEGEQVLSTMKYWLSKLAEFEGYHAVIHGGTLSEIESLDESSSLLVKRLAELNDYARQHNIELLYENQIPDKSQLTHVHPTSLSEWVDTLIKTDTVACLDLGHLAVHGESFKDTVGKLGNLLKSVHVSDNDGISDLHLLPGEGIVLNENPLDYLSEIDYNGPVVFEISPYKYTLDDILKHPLISKF